MHMPFWASACKNSDVVEGVGTPRGRDVCASFILVMCHAWHNGPSLPDYWCPGGTNSSLVMRCATGLVSTGGACSNRLVSIRCSFILLDKQYMVTSTQPWSLLWCLS